MMHEIEVKIMKSIIIKGWDKIGTTKAFLLTFQLIAMEANIAMPLFREATIVEEIVKVNVDVDLTLPMSKVVENSLQSTSTPPSTSVRPLGTIHNMHAQAKKKNKYKLRIENP